MKSAVPRDTRTDLMRLVFMFMICLVHAVGCDDSRWTHWLTNVSFAGVIGFVLISGYYGIRFSWWKVLKIEGVGLGCAVTVMTVASLLNPTSFSLSHFLNEVIRVFKGYWFIHAYILLMCLAPLVSDARSSCLQTFLPVILAVYIWSFLAYLPGLQKLFPHTPGLQAFSGITLFAIYLIGRLYRQYDLDRRLKTAWVVPCTVLCGVIAACVIPPTNGWFGALARYNSPFLLVLAIGIFWQLRRMPKMTSAVLARVLSVLTPSVLSVYLLHCNDYGRELLRWLERGLADYGVGGYPMFFVLALFAFVGGFLLDIPRRLLAGLVGGLWPSNYRRKTA